MLKLFICTVILLSLSCVPIIADNELTPYRINFLFENDIYNKTDEDYSSGESLSAIFYVNKPNNFIFDILDRHNSEKTDAYLNIAITNQIFTPSDIETAELIPDDHPYAGWSYIKIALYKVSTKQLNSISLKIGIVGPSSGSQQIQSNVHKITGSKPIQGWNNQIKDEVGINLQYLYKRHYMPQVISGMESSITPFIEAQLGNISTSLNSGFIARFGWNIPKDFGFSNIDIGNEDGIPIYNEYKNIKRGPWSFNFNLTLSGTAVAHDIFLDGNTFTNSPSVEKENYVGHFGYGFSTRYKHFVLEFLGVVSSKKFKTANGYHAVGTTKVAWIF